MEKISFDEFNKLQFKSGKGGGSKADPVIEEIKALRVKQALFVPREEWLLRSELPGYVATLIKQRNIPIIVTCRTLLNGEGWAILRIK